MSILIAEDEPAIARILSANLERAGFVVRVVDNGSAVLERIAQDPPDLLLLDIMLPGIDGYSICRQIRQRSALPIIMVTARRAEAERLKGFELGVDDYICKPFSPSEVVARVRSVLRRAQSPGTPTNEQVQLGELSVSPQRREITFNGQCIEMTTSEFKLLHTLVRAPNRVFSREQLLDCLQGDTTEKTDRTIDTHIKNLRKKLGLAKPGTHVIQTVYGEGYRLLYPFSEQ